MTLAPAWAKLGVGLPSAATALHVAGDDITSAPGTGTGTVTIGTADSLHMQIDRNDIRVAGPAHDTYGAMHLQRHGGPIAVHGSKPLDD